MGARKGNGHRRAVVLDELDVEVAYVDGGAPADLERLAGLLAEWLVRAYRAGESEADSSENPLDPRTVSCTHVGGRDGTSG